MTDAGMQEHECASVSVLEEYKGPQKWISVNQPSSKRAVNNLKSCISFQFPPYWDGFHLFQWGRLERFPLKCHGEESQQTFPVLPAIKLEPRTAVTVVHGGTSKAGRWDG